MTKYYIGYMPMEFRVQKLPDKDQYKILKLGKVYKESDEMTFVIVETAIKGIPKEGDIFSCQCRFNETLNKFMPFTDGQFKR